MREIRPDSQYQVRKPTKEEYEQLWNYFVSLGNDEEQATNLINQYWYAVLDDYISDCPAYAGKVLIAVYGMPEFYELFIWDNGKIKQIEQESGMRKGLEMVKK